MREATTGTTAVGHVHIHCMVDCVGRNALVVSPCVILQTDVEKASGLYKFKITYELILNIFSLQHKAIGIGHKFKNLDCPIQVICT